LVDANILISAIRFPNGKVADAFWHAHKIHEIALTTFIIDGLQATFARKWPDKIDDLLAFISTIKFEILPESDVTKIEIRDTYDQPILNATLAAEVDIILTGDKDFHALDLAAQGYPQPIILSPSEYLAEFPLGTLASTQIGVS
jgi:predicted nucleic acid-binding protein